MIGFGYSVASPMCSGGAVRNVVGLQESLALEASTLRGDALKGRKGRGRREGPQSYNLRGLLPSGVRGKKITNLSMYVSSCFKMCTF